MKKAQLVRSSADIRHTQSNSVATRAVSVSLCAFVAFTGLAISLAAPNAAVSAAASSPVADQATVTAAALADDVGYTSLQPARLLDTRTNSPTIDNAYAGGGALGQGGVVNLTVVGRGNGVSNTARDTACNTHRLGYRMRRPWHEIRVLQPQAAFASNINRDRKETIQCHISLTAPTPP